MISAALTALALTACSSNANFNEQNGNISDNISDKDIGFIKNNYSSGAVFYDAKIVDLDLDGHDELLVLAAKANVRNFDVWTRSGDQMNLEYSFGAGKVNFIDRIKLKKSKRTVIRRITVCFLCFGASGDHPG